MRRLDFRTSMTQKMRCVLFLHASQTQTRTDACYHGSAIPRVRQIIPTFMPLCMQYGKPGTLTYFLFTARHPRRGVAPLDHMHIYA